MPRLPLPPSWPLLFFAWALPSCSTQAKPSPAPTLQASASAPAQSPSASSPPAPAPRGVLVLEELSSAPPQEQSLLREVGEWQKETQLRPRGSSSQAAADQLLARTEWPAAGVLVGVDDGRFFELGAGRSLGSLVEDGAWLAPGMHFLTACTWTPAFACEYLSFSLEIEGRAAARPVQFLEPGGTYYGEKSDPLVYLLAPSTSRFELLVEGPFSEGAEAQVITRAAEIEAHQLYRVLELGSGDYRFSLRAKEESPAGSAPVTAPALTRMISVNRELNPTPGESN